MSRLDELLKEYCPDGVEYKKISDVCETITDYTAAGSFADIAKHVKYINNSIEYAQLVRTTDLKNKFADPAKFVFVSEDAFNYLWRVNLDAEGLVLPNVGNCGEVYYIEPEKLPFKHNVLGPNAIWVKSDHVINRFLYHLFQSNEFQRKLKKIISPTGQTKFNKTNFRNLSIPVPPLPVQEEIVRILDSFTELTTKLITELTAELAERKKQYEYYRNELLTPKKDTKFYKLGEISTIIRGASPRPIKKYITTDPDGVNWIKIGDVSPESKYIMSVKEKITKEGSKKSRIVHKGDFILSNSMSFGRPYILDIDGCIHDGWLSISNFKNKVTPDYLYHILLSSRVQSEMKKRASRGGSIKNLNADIVKEIKIPVPGVDTQNRITKVLDNFESICSDLNIGLPAEIEARQKQYEYYRDALLTFAETGDIIAQTDRTSLD